MCLAGRGFRGAYRDVYFEESGSSGFDRSNAFAVGTG